MPCGLAARDVLRLEMGYPLYGQDLFESSTALEAGLGWAVAFDKGEFRGREALLRQRDEGVPSRLRGLLMEERRHIPRAHYPVFRGRPADRRGHERDVLADPAEGDRARVPLAGRRGRRRDREVRGRHPRPPGRGDGRARRRSWIAALDRPSAEVAGSGGLDGPLADRLDEVADRRVAEPGLRDQPLERPVRPSGHRGGPRRPRTGRTARCPAGEPGRTPAPRRSTPSA